MQESTCTWLNPGAKTTPELRFQQSNWSMLCWNQTSGKSCTQRRTLHCTFEAYPFCRYWCPEYMSMGYPKIPSMFRCESKTFRLCRKESIRIFTKARITASNFNFSNLTITLPPWRTGPRCCICNVNVLAIIDACLSMLNKKTLNNMYTWSL